MSWLFASHMLYWCLALYYLNGNTSCYQNSINVDVWICTGFLLKHWIDCMICTILSAFHSRTQHSKFLRPGVQHPNAIWPYVRNRDGLCGFSKAGFPKPAAPLLTAAKLLCKLGSSPPLEWPQVRHWNGWSQNLYKWLLEGVVVTRDSEGIMFSLCVFVRVCLSMFGTMFVRTI